MTITQETRREANAAVDRKKREAEVLKVFKEHPAPKTARRMLYFLPRWWDITMVRPRMTELTDRGILEVVSKVREGGSRGSVALWDLVKK